VFIDEFGAATNMARRYARGLRGERVVGKVPHGHWKLLSTIAAMDVRGIVTACSFEGATDTAMFIAFVERFLLKKLKPKQIVIMDNLSAHNSPHVDRLIESVGARVLRLPPHSPDYNPIEMAISKMKSVLRREGHRTIDALNIGLKHAIEAIQPTDAIAMMKHCGYSASFI